MTSQQFRVAGVMGWPIAHSKSPVIQRFWLDRAGIAGDYARFPVPPEHLADALRALPALGLSGVNLTIPHKEAALRHMDRLSPEAQVIGAVNTVLVEDGQLAGHNTDAPGFLEPLARLELAGRTATVIGAGGASRAVLMALKGAGIGEVRLVNRTVARADELLHAFELPGSSFGLDEMDDALDGSMLLVNTSSLGMAGQPSLDPDLAPLRRDAIVYDIVYAPLETGLLRTARAKGLATVDGLAMLVGQAAEAFRLFYGAAPDRSEDAQLRALLLR